MSAAPSNLVAELRVPVPRPRAHALRYSPQLVRSVRQLEELVLGMSGPAAPGDAGVDG
jgi:hypothetical protein